MVNKVMIKRRVRKDKQYVEVLQQVTLIKRDKHTSLVQLDNGDIIKRKNKDVIMEEK